VHRNLSPRSVYFTDAARETLKIGGFGRSSLCDDQGQPLRADGPPSERERRVAVPEFRPDLRAADVWAVGAVLGSALLLQYDAASDRPFAAWMLDMGQTNLAACLQSRVCAKPSLAAPGTYSDGLVRLVVCLLAFAPTQRLTAEQALAMAQNVSPSASPPPGSPAGLSAQKPFARHVRHKT
jgi:serine/threonine protein kinase